MACFNSLPLVARRLQLRAGAPQTAHSNIVAWMIQIFRSERGKRRALLGEDVSITECIECFLEGFVLATCPAQFHKQRASCFDARIWLVPQFDHRQTRSAGACLFQ